MAQILSNEQFQILVDLIKAAVPTLVAILIAYLKLQGKDKIIKTIVEGVEQGDNDKTKAAIKANAIAQGTDSKLTKIVKDLTE